MSELILASTAGDATPRLPEWKRDRGLFAALASPGRDAAAAGPDSVSCSGAAPPVGGRAARHSAPHRERDRGRARRAGEVRQGGAAPAAEAEDPDDVGVDARLRPRLLADLGMAVRARLRGAALHP